MYRTQCISFVHDCMDAGVRAKQEVRAEESEATIYMEVLSGSIFAPRQLLLHCSNKLHPCSDAIPTFPPSEAVVCRGCMVAEERRFKGWPYALWYRHGALFLSLQGHSEL